MDVEAIVAKVTQEVYARLASTEQASGTKPEKARTLSGAELADKLEHSLLNPDTSAEKIRQGCDEARKYGFANQSSMIRAALDHYIKETKRKQRRSQIAQKAGELAALYDYHSELTVFTTIDGDDFYEADRNLGNRLESYNRSGDAESASGRDH